MLGSRLLLGLMLLETLAAGPLFFIRAELVNWCGSTSTCDFVCDCWDCSDENQCGYQKELGPLGTLFTCDFEGTSCGWEDISTTAFRWSPTQASISTWGTKPPFDHTLGTDGGWFMSTTDQKVKPSTTAQLRSPVMREAAATCEIRAWYHLSGTGLITTHHPALSLELSFGNSTITVWRSALTSSHPWRELVAYTGRIPGTFQVTFSATQNFSQTLQLALDDVEFRNCGRPRAQTCGPAERLCQQGGCVTPDRWCDGTEDCWNGEDEMASNCTSYSACSFEEGWCKWETLPNQTLSWINSSSLLGPPPHDWPTRDHTTNSQAGFFVYLDHQLQVGKAWMVSPALRTSENGSCHLVFYLYLRSSGSLNIYSRTEGTLKLLQSRSGDLGDYWFREKVDFHLAETFQIVLEGTVIAGHQGSIALDDLILSPGCLVQSDNISAFLPPELDAPQGPCGQDEFTCQDEKGCIGSDLVCDFKADCTDISDEADCGATTSTTGTGGWTDLSVGRLKWTVQNASGQLRSGGISLALQEGPGQMLSMARAATPAMGPSGLACVVEMNTTVPQGFLALAVADVSLGTRHWVWYALGNASAMWVHARVPLGARARPFQLQLMGSEELSSVGETPHLRVHNITFMNCDVSATFPKSAGLSCNFETNWCAWYAEQNDGFEWERSTGPGWGQDHTTSTGSFLFVDPSAFGANGLSTRLLSSPQTAAEVHTCLSFWYRMEGPQIGTLSLLAQFPGEPEQLLWTQTSSSGSVWHLAFSTLSHRPGQSFQVIFEAFRNGFLGLMALDDISVTPGSCGNQTQCSFEVDECGLWVKDGPAWLRQNGSRGSGPSADHTLGTLQGHYFLLNTSGSTLPAGRKATLSSGIFPPGLHTHCMMFWYYLSSSGPASLHVYVEEASGQRKVSTVHLTPGEAWHYANTSIWVQEDWQVALVVEGGDEGPNSYLALDDLHILEGACSEPGSCDFERSPCGWTKPPGTWYGWDWKEAATPSQSPSPKEDHTLDNEAGHYIYVDVALLGLGSQAARLASEPLPSTVGSCLRFHYHMDFTGQSSQAELRVKLSSLQGERTLWQATGPQSRSWEKQSLLVSSLTEFQIVLEATSGAWPSSETIAVDDISYNAEQGCEEAPGIQDPEPGSSSGHRHSDAGLVASIVCFVLLVVAAALIATYCLKKRSTSGERLETEHTTVQGFDNVTFRDDIVIIPSLPIDREAE